MGVDLENSWGRCSLPWNGWPEMAAPVLWACCAVLAAATAVVYAQRHSPQEAPHVQYERLGSDVTLPCGTANWDAAVTWRVNGTDLAPDLLNGSQLVLRGLELGHSGLYACFHRDSWHLRHQVLLHVGLKPDPPENVVARPVPSNPRRLEVTWQTPSTWPDPDSFPLKFFLRYRPLILDQWQHVELSDGTAHTITDAYAGKEYIIQVAAKDNEIGTWSDWSVAAHATPWTEEPRHLTTEAQVPETTTSTTSSLAPPPTTKICDPGELGSSGGPSAPFSISVPVTLALAAAAATASSLLIWTTPLFPNARAGNLSLIHLLTTVDWSRI
ncbi:ciliary neurotrophic factor receptor subunit alpha isoform X4 [Suricata suricatta]|uniref:ciliary neurotrophic factor receptor subunit alpha isoform X4 n=1 Tax=Suricata suricatta TaxID=37032 RepID=UPI001155D9E6|nr:ciliary neurotrophic factor receptor subunit alpha isoform X4 [Suricata suricatta]